MALKVLLKRFFQFIKGNDFACFHFLVVYPDSFTFGTMVFCKMVKFGQSA